MSNQLTSSSAPTKTHYDNVIIGSGHNGLIAACYLAAAGQSVLILEKNNYIGGATASQQVFPDYEAWLSRYSYLIALLPPTILSELQVSFETRRRRIASFTPYFDRLGNHKGLLLSNENQDFSRDSLIEMCGTSAAWNNYQKLMQLELAIASVAWPTLLQPLQHRQTFEKHLDSDIKREAWNAFVNRPLGETIEKYADHDALRGLLLTDAKIGVFTHAHDASLLQNRCFLYHIIGNGNGEWRVPVGGMRALVDALVTRANQLGVEMRINTAAENLELGHKFHSITYNQTGISRTVDASRVLVNASPRVFHKLLGKPYRPSDADEGSVMKVNMLLKKLPKLKCGLASEDAFAGSFHIDEGYTEMQLSYEQAASGKIPDKPPAEIYCHTLTDNSILSTDLQSRGFHTLTLFGLDIPYRLFSDNPIAKRNEIKKRYIEALDRLCAEPFIECLARAKNGEPCIEVKSPLDLEEEVSLDLGNIFHNSLTWFFTDSDQEVGTWGVETGLDRVYWAGSAAKRGGAVSGIPGRNAAQCIFEQLGIR